MNDTILLVPVLLPMLFSFAVYILGRRSKKERDIFADIVGAAEFAVCAVLLAAVAPSTCPSPRSCG